MPAEWDLHESTWLAWPHNQETWSGKRLGQIEEIFLQMLEALLPGEIVHLLVCHEKQGTMVFKRLEKMGIGSANLKTHVIPTADVWIRDYGPTFLTDKKGKKAWCKWIFNAWGGKYGLLAQDNAVFDSAKALIPHPAFEAGIVLEGGSLEVNGEGTCLVTEQCLLNPNRNPEMTREEIEQVLRDFLGVSQIIWLGAGIAGDDTDGHIDDMARFVSADTILMASEENFSDENCEILNRNWERLKSKQTPRGSQWNLIRLPMPEPVTGDGTRLPASYANFYIANKAVLLPVFKDKRDERAIKILNEIFPKREIIPVNCRALVCGLGGIHCVTQQEPR